MKWIERIGLGVLFCAVVYFTNERFGLVVSLLLVPFLIVVWSWRAKMR